MVLALCFHISCTHEKPLLVLVASALLITLFQGVAKAIGETNIYQITCVSSGRVNVYLEYGINAITITNPNG